MASPSWATPLVDAASRLTCDLDSLNHAAQITAPVLITEPNASRRRDLARSIHDHSCFQGGPFVAWSCQIAEARNGHARRDTRLVLELARGGSVFLDAIEWMSHDVQDELFTFLTDESRQRSRTDDPREDQVRVIAGTASLLPGVRSGAFDTALFYRLNVIHLADDGAGNDVLTEMQFLRRYR